MVCLNMYVCVSQFPLLQKESTESAWISIGVNKHSEYQVIIGSGNGLESMLITQIYRYKRGKYTCSSPSN